MLVGSGPYTLPWGCSGFKWRPCHAPGLCWAWSQACHPGAQGSLSPAQGGKTGNGQGRTQSKAWVIVRQAMPARPRAA